MNILWISAHPDARSLNGFLTEKGQQYLREAGHSVTTSDLYAMGWNPVVDADSYGHDEAVRLHVATAAKAAHLEDAVAADIRTEQQKLDEADAIILQFPLWWFGMPAILKGWFDRVWHQGYAYGNPGPNGEWVGYGDGFLAGKRAMVVATLGGPEFMYGERGIHGSVDDLLFPLQHGALFYAGAEVLPPFLAFGVDRWTADDADLAAQQLQERLQTITTTQAIPFRTQSSGDYDKFVLRSEVAPEISGLSVHRVSDTGGRR
jgi:NAD(P)H dehydrogenase (quinone)